MFAERLSRREKVFRLQQRLETQATQLAAADAPPRQHDDTIFRLCGHPASVDLRDLQDVLAPKSAIGFAVAAPDIVTALREYMDDAQDGTNKLTARSIRVYPSAVAWDAGHRARIHARVRFYGFPRYDWVSVRAAEAEVWYARILLLFAAQVNHVWKEFAVLHWLKDFEPTREHVVLARHYKYWRPKPVVESMSTLWRRARFISSPMVDGNDTVFLSLPYGASSLAGVVDDADSEGEDDQQE